MREICVKQKLTGAGMRGYAQMVCASENTFTQLESVETALRTSTNTAHNIDGTQYVFDLHSRRRSSKRLLIRWSRVRISPDPPVQGSYGFQPKKHLRSNLSAFFIIDTQVNRYIALMVDQTLI